MNKKINALALVLTSILVSPIVAVHIEDFNSALELLQSAGDGLESTLNTFGNEWTTLKESAVQAENQIVTRFNAYQDLYECLTAKFEALKTEKEGCETNISAVLASIENARSGAEYSLSQLQNQYETQNTERNELVEHINETFGDSEELAVEVFNLMQAVSNAYDAAVSERTAFINQLNTLQNEIQQFALKSDEQNAAEAICDYTADDNCAAGYTANQNAAINDANSYAETYSSITDYVDNLHQEELNANLSI